MLAISANKHGEAPKHVASTAKKAALSPATSPRLAWIIVSKLAVRLFIKSFCFQECLHLEENTPEDNERLQLIFANKSQSIVANQVAHRGQEVLNIFLFGRSDLKGHE